MIYLKIIFISCCLASCTFQTNGTPDVGESHLVHIKTLLDLSSVDDDNSNCTIYEDMNLNIAYEELADPVIVEYPEVPCDPLIESEEAYSQNCEMVYCVTYNGHCWLHLRQSFFIDVEKDAPHRTTGIWWIVNSYDNSPVCSYSYQGTSHLIFEYITKGIN